jgi:hypothetical protein
MSLGKSAGTDTLASISEKMQVDIVIQISSNLPIKKNLRHY